MNFSEPDFLLFLQALRFAADQHANQRRKDGDTPYINHPIEVVQILWETGGVRDARILAAAILHDVVEDTGTPTEEITQRFGAEISDLVMEVTDDKSLPKVERKRLQIVHAPQKSPAARQIKLADKISNLKTIVQAPPKDWSRQRKLEYLDWSKQVIDGLRGPNPDLEALYDKVLGQAREQISNEG
jgi:(p)ppGpp synthase/HD superfamily hydrolase